MNTMEASISCSGAPGNEQMATGADGCLHVLIIGDDDHAVRHGPGGGGAPRTELLLSGQFPGMSRKTELLLLLLVEPFYKRHEFVPILQDGFVRLVALRLGEFHAFVDFLAAAGLVAKEKNVGSGPSRIQRRPGRTGRARSSRSKDNVYCSCGLMRQAMP